MDAKRADTAPRVSTHGDGKRRPPVGGGSHRACGGERPRTLLRLGPVDRAVGSGVALDLRGWANSGLMTFFFLERVISRFRSSDLMGVAEVIEHLARRAEQGLAGA